MAHHVLLGGGSGFVGRNLAKSLTQRGHKVTLVSRSVGSRHGLPSITWSELKQQRLPKGVTAVINLAGKPFFNVPSFLWTASVKKEVHDSRVSTTALLANLVDTAETPPKVFIATSAVGIYSSDCREPQDEDHTTPASDWAGLLCQDIESAAAGCVSPHVRRAVIRLGVVLGKDNPAYAGVALSAKLGVACSLGDGTQPFPWIHLQDAVQLYTRVVESDMKGIFNAVAPTITTNSEYTQAVARSFNRRAFLDSFPLSGAAHWASRTVCSLGLGEDRAPMLLAGPRVQPTRTLASGYQFQFANVEDAAQALARDQ